MRFLILFFLICSSIAEAKLSHLTCSANGLHIIFINGVGVDVSQFEDFERQSRVFASELEKSWIDLSSIPENVTFDAYHNSSFLKPYDGFEAWKLYMEGETTEDGGFFSQDTITKIFNYKITQNAKALSKTCHTYLFEKHCQKLDEILFFKKTYEDLAKMKFEVDKVLSSGKKILFVSHSAGALFVDNIRDYIKRVWSDKYLQTSHLALARPLETQHINQYHLTFEDDQLTERLRFIPLVGGKVPPANLDKTQKCIDPKDPDDIFSNHSYINCYLGQLTSQNTADSPILNEPAEMPARSHVKNAIYRVASYLTNNDKNCCDGKNGKVWLNGVTPGGFVSEKIRITGGEIFVSRMAQLCGFGEIKGSQNSNNYEFHSGTKIEGEVFIDSKFYIQNLKTLPNSKLSIISGPTKNFSSQNFTLHGELDWKNNLSTSLGYTSLSNLNLYGKNKVTGDVSFGGGSYYNVTLESPSALLTVGGSSNKIDTKLKISYLGTVNARFLENDIVGDFELFGSTNLQVTNNQFLGSMTLKSPDIEIYSSEIRNSSTIQTGKRIIMSKASLGPTQVQCTDTFSSSGNTTALTLDNCEVVSIGLGSNIGGPVSGEGSLYLHGEFANGGTILASSGQSVSIQGTVGGSFNITAPISTGITAGVSGDLNVVSNCTNRTKLDMRVSWVGSYSVNFAENGYTEWQCFYDVNQEIYCGPSGVACI